MKPDIRDIKDKVNDYVDKAFIRGYEKGLIDGRKESFTQIDIEEAYQRGFLDGKSDKDTHKNYKITKYALVPKDTGSDEKGYTLKPIKDE